MPNSPRARCWCPGTTRTLEGNTPAYAPDFIWKGGITFQKEKCFRITFSGVHVSDQFWADNNLGNPAVGDAAARPRGHPVLHRFQFFERILSDEECSVNRRRLESRATRNIIRASS